ncbi:MAG: PKD domain-containing protein [bacterium]
MADSGSTAADRLPPEAPFPSALDAAGLPAGLPADGVQPWEAVDAGGHVISPEHRSSSSVNGNTDFTPGVERFLEAGDVTDNGEASRINGTDSSAASYAMYRVSMESAQPGVVSVDANLLGNGSEYYVGLSNYGTDRWDWQGPFSDNHVRLQAATPAGAQLTSVLGNTFITLLCPAGSSIDAVGIGVNQFEAADAQAPAAPTGLVLTPVAGGIELSWSPVLEPDLAGYLVYHASAGFSNPHSAGVRRVNHLEGGTRHLLAPLSGRTWLAIAAVDFAGNESAITAVLDATPLAGQLPELQLISDSASGLINAAIQLSASGADSYDWDLDGDGVFEIQADALGTQFADTTATGIIRPGLRGSDASGEAVALGGLSLLITGNTRPVASAVADPQSGVAPLDVAFTGSAEDSEDAASALEYAWDFDGDGIYEAGTDTLTPDPQQYANPGIHGVKFRVTDSEAAWDVDTVPVLVTEAEGPVAVLEINPDAVEAGELFTLGGGSSTSPSGIVLYEWDTDGDGSFEISSGAVDHLTTSLGTYGFHTLRLRVTDGEGLTATDEALLVVRGWTQPRTLDGSGGTTGYFSDIIEVAGNPAVVYVDLGTDEVNYTRALDPQGSTWSSPITLATIVGASPYYAEMQLIQGNPAVCFGVPLAEDAYYLRSLDAIGSSWPAKQKITGNSTSLVTSLQEVGGLPAVAYVNDFKDLLFIRAQNLAGSSWDGPVTIDTSDNYAYANMEIVDGNPAVAAYATTAKQLVYKRATNALGTAWGTLKTVDATAQSGVFPDMLIVDGNPAIAYLDDAADRLVFIRATDSTGAGWGSRNLLWDATVTNSPVETALVNGNPAIIFIDPDQQLSYIRAIDPLGSAWSYPEVLDRYDNAQFPSLTLINGSPAVSYLRGTIELGFTNYLP